MVVRPTKERAKTTKKKTESGDILDTRKKKTFNGKKEYRSKKKIVAKDIFNTCHFAADARICQGGYGRPSTTWAEKELQKSQNSLLQNLHSRDGMEDGILLQKRNTRKLLGNSRASKRRQKRRIPENANQLISIDSEDILIKTTIGKTNRKKDSELKTKPDNESKETPDGVKKGKEKQLTDKSLQPLVQQKGDKQKKRKKKAKKRRNLPEEQTTNISPTISEDKIASFTKYIESKCGEKITTESGLEFVDIQIGNGMIPKVGEMVTVRYRGSLGIKGAGIGKGIMTFYIGSDQVITGLNEGVSTMRSGGQRSLFVPAVLAYGSTGKNSSEGKCGIPPDADLCFFVELIRIGKRKRDEDDEEDKNRMPLPKSFSRKKIKSIV